jgi:protein tyrosine phosphatase (PTP) superfamily phosphohydrolase (DUF442 family)
MAVDPEHIRGWLRLNAQVTTSGQPSESELAQLADMGVATIINLALHSHDDALPDEAATVAALGMRYVHIPVPFDRPEQAHYDAFCDAMAQNADAKVHVHCIVNARVSAFFYRYHRDQLGWSEDTARAQMVKIWDPAEWGERGQPWLNFIA